MIVKRYINGEPVAFMLTEDELHNAFLEYQYKSYQNEINSVNLLDVDMRKSTRPRRVAIDIVIDAD